MEYLPCAQIIALNRAEDLEGTSWEKVE